jgi:hypothetical protein
LVLGGIVGTGQQINDNFHEICSKGADLHAAIDKVQDAATELVLKKTCADVSKVAYCLRLNGDHLVEACDLPCYSKVLRDSVARTLGGDVGDHGWLQATCGTSEGGLGMRAAEEIALPGFIASRISAAPAVQSIFNRMETAGLAPLGSLGQAYHARTNRAVEAFKATFGQNAQEHSIIESVLTEAVQTVGDWWQRISTGEPPRRPGPTVVGLQIDDDDNADADTGLGPLRLQKKLCALVDAAKMARLLRIFEDNGMIEDTLRVNDLRDQHQEHSWIWALNPVNDPVLPEADWLRAMRLRLGCMQVSTDILCAKCGERVLDKCAYHALCCARGESTRGHNRVRDVLHAGFAAADAGASIEVLGLIPSQPDLRPADVLTSAAKPNVTAAVDVGVSAPHSSGAGADCTESMRREKLRKYGQYLPELERQGIEYAPATFSAYGRRHPCVTEMMTLAARVAARRRGLGSHAALLRRWYRSVTCEIWRRASRMILACLPREPLQAEYLLDGETSGAPVADERGGEPMEEGASEDELESNMAD